MKKDKLNELDEEQNEAPILFPERPAMASDTLVAAITNVESITSRQKAHNAKIAAGGK